MRMRSITTAPTLAATDTARYARTIEVSNRIRWDIDRDVIRGREFDLVHAFAPDRLSLIDEIADISAERRRFLNGRWRASASHTWARRRRSSDQTSIPTLLTA